LLRERQAPTMAITDDEALAAAVNRPLVLPRGQPEMLAPMAQVAVGQLFAYHLAVAKGIDPDQPRGLHKVTATR